MSALEVVRLLFSSLEDCVLAPTEIGTEPGLDGLAIYVERLNYLVEVDLTLLAIDGHILDLGLQFLFRNLVNLIPDLLIYDPMNSPSILFIKKATCNLSIDNKIFMSIQSHF